MNVPSCNCYDPAVAAALVGAAAAAYGDDSAMQRWAEEQDCGACEVLRDERTDTLAFVAAGNEFTVVAFRGTRDLRNWMTNLDARRVPMDKGQGTMDSVEVHEGFQRALDAVWPRLAEVVRRLAAGKADIFFTGHSLGGALAMLAASTSSPQAAFPSAWVFTFGQPRVGNAEWARWYDARLRGRSFRVVHAADIVARVPWLLDFYRHAGTEVFYPMVGRGSCRASGPGSTGASPYLIDAPWWRKAASDAVAVYREWKHGQVALLADHHINHYVRLLRQNAAPLLRPVAAESNALISFLLSVFLCVICGQIS